MVKFFIQHLNSTYNLIIYNYITKRRCYQVLILKIKRVISIKTIFPLYTEKYNRGSGINSLILNELSYHRIYVFVAFAINCVPIDILCRMESVLYVSTEE